MQDRIDTLCELASSPYTSEDDIKAYVNEEKFDYDGKHSIYEMSAVDMAARYGTVDALQCLITYVRVSTDYSKQTKNLLQWGIENPDLLMRQYLFDPRVSIYKYLNDNTTELHWHALAGRFDAIKAILAKNPEAILAVNNAGKNVFMWLHYGINIKTATVEMEQWLEQFVRNYSQELLAKKDWEKLAQLYALRSHDEATGVFSLMLLQQSIDAYELAAQDNLMLGQDDAKNRLEAAKLKEEYIRDCITFARDQNIAGTWHAEIIANREAFLPEIENLDPVFTASLIFELAQSKLDYAISLFKSSDEWRVISIPKILRLCDEVALLASRPELQDKAKAFFLKIDQIRIGIARTYCHLATQYLNHEDYSRAATVAEEFTLPFLSELIHKHHLDKNNVNYLFAWTHQDLACISAASQTKADYLQSENHSELALYYFNKINLQDSPAFYKELEKEIHQQWQKVQKLQNKKPKALKPFKLPIKHVSITPTPNHHDNQLMRIPTPLPKHGLFRSRSMGAIETIHKKKKALFTPNF